MFLMVAIIKPNNIVDPIVATYWVPLSVIKICMMMFTVIFPQSKNLAKNVRSQNVTQKQLPVKNTQDSDKKT